jgi:hypothetical protein
MVLLHAAIEVVESEGFDELLDSVRGRIDEIESLHRTRELTVCAKATILFEVTNHFYSGRPPQREIPYVLSFRRKLMALLRCAEERLNGSCSTLMPWPVAV